MVLRPESDISITFYSNKVVFNYVNNSIHRFLKICSNFSVSKLLLSLGIKALQEFLYCFWYSRLKKFVVMEK